MRLILVYALQHHMQHTIYLNGGARWRQLCAQLEKAPLEPMSALHLEAQEVPTQTQNLEIIRGVIHLSSDSVGGLGLAGSSAPWE